MTYMINEESARRAKMMNSFSDYEPGSATASYNAQVAEATAIAEQQKARVDAMYHEKIDRLLDKYCRLLAANINDAYRIDAMCPSILVAGGSNFPVRKKQRQNDARDRNMEEYQQVRKILDQIRGVGTGGISADDPRAVEKLKAKLNALEKEQEAMKAANAAIRMKDTAKGDAKLAALGYTPEQIYKLRKPDFCGRIGYPAYMLSNNNANIRRIRERIAELEKQKENPADGWEFAGGKVVANHEENRLQILFNEKPDENMRTKLKSHGFRWSPRNQAWQRQLTNNAIYDAKHLLV